MTFLSFEFVLFILPVLIIYYLTPALYKKWVLIVASLTFIALTSPSFLIYALMFVLVNYTVARIIENKDGKYRKVVYYSGQVFNIGGLFLFKYLGFLMNNVFSLFNLANEEFIVKIIAPIGISYYTFQGISYLYLIFKGGDNPERNFGNLCLYMLFFPKFLAGPIERHRIFLPQVNRLKVVQETDISEGLKLILWGAFKKVMIGDTLGILVNKVYGNVEGFEGFPLWIVFFLQAIQLYGDFSGYTDMALGLARLFGFRLSPNFNRPFFAQSVAQFWKRWHISLSSWCNDFIYNRLMLKHRKKGDAAVLYAIFSAFMIIGIWHGAKWTFIIIGVLQVIALSYEYYTKRWRKKFFSRINNSLTKWISRALVFLFVAFYHIFFFADNLSDALVVISNLFVSSFKLSGLGFNIPFVDFSLAIISTALVFLVEWREEESLSLIKWYRQWPITGRWAIYFLALFMVVYFSKNSFFFTYAEF